MSFSTPFQPSGGAKTQLINPTSTPSATINVVGSGGLRVNNQSSASPVWIAVGTSAGSSSMTAALPTTSAASNTWPMAAQGIESFNFGPNYWISFMTSGGSGGPVTITEGMGS